VVSQTHETAAKERQEAKQGTKTGH